MTILEIPPRTAQEEAFFEAWKKILSEIVVGNATLAYAEWNTKAFTATLNLTNTTAGNTTTTLSAIEAFMNQLAMNPFVMNYHNGTRINVTYAHMLEVGVLAGELQGFVGGQALTIAAWSRAIPKINRLQTLAKNVLNDINEDPQNTGFKGFLLATERGDLGFLIEMLTTMRRVAEALANVAQQSFPEYDVADVRFQLYTELAFENRLPNTPQELAIVNTYVQRIRQNVTTIDEVLVELRKVITLEDTVPASRRLLAVVSRTTRELLELHCNRTAILNISCANANAQLQQLENAVTLLNPALVTNPEQINLIQWNTLITLTNGIGPIFANLRMENSLFGVANSMIASRIPAMVEAGRNLNQYIGAVIAQVEIISNSTIDSTFNAEAANISLGIIGGGALIIAVIYLGVKAFKAPKRYNMPTGLYKSKRVPSPLPTDRSDIVYKAIPADDIKWDTDFMHDKMN